MKCTSCELLYTEIVKPYTSIVYKKNGGVQPWGYRILPSFLLWLLEMCMQVRAVETLYIIVPSEISHCNIAVDNFTPAVHSNT